MTIRRGYLKKDIKGWTTGGRYHTSNLGTYRKGTYVRTLSLRTGGESVITRGSTGWGMSLVVKTRELTPLLSNTK